MPSPEPLDHPAQTQAQAQATAQINTYHCCYCTHLLLASTHYLDALPTRRPPALDRGLILPLPPPHFDNSPDSSSSDSEAERPPAEEQLSKRRNRHEKSGGGSGVGYSILLSTTVDRKPVMIRREDGFEKRLLLRCGRCRVVVGYKLDEAHFGGGEGVSEVGKEGRVVYLLSGGLMGTEDMAAGKKAIEDAEN
jgi:hypothetical protein